MAARAGWAATPAGGTVGLNVDLHVLHVLLFLPLLRCCCRCAVDWHGLTRPGPPPEPLERQLACC